VVELFRRFRPPEKAGCNLTPREIRRLKRRAQLYARPDASPYQRRPQPPPRIPKPMPKLGP
jgi:hypothetical protein